MRQDGHLSVIFHKEIVHSFSKRIFIKDSMSWHKFDHVAIKGFFAKRIIVLAHMNTHKMRNCEPNFGFSRKKMKINFWQKLSLTGNTAISIKFSTLLDLITNK